MSNRYDRVMEHITVSDEMRSRLLDSISSADLTPPRAAQLSRLRPWLAAAACVAVVAGGALYFRPPERPVGPPPGGTVTVVNPIVTVASLWEVTEAVGFPVTDQVDLPFPAEKTTYQVYSGTMAQIAWENAENMAVFRKSPGPEPNSGDYGDYTSVSPLTVGEMNGELRENEGGPSLALWFDGTYSYSLQLSGQIDLQTWTGMITQLSQ